MKKGAKVILIISAIIYLAIGVAIYFYVYTIPKINGALTKTAVITYGSLASADQVNALIIRDETVVYAKEDGELGYYSAETEKTRKGSAVLDIYPSGSSAVAYLCEHTGFVSYYYDGYEEQFYPDMISELFPEDIEGLSIEPVNTVRTRAVKNTPVYKLLNSDVWYILFNLPKERLDLYRTGKKVTVDFGDAKIDATVDSIIGAGDTKLISLNTKKYYVNFAKIRTAEVSVITQDYEGLVVPNTAIGVDENGNQGVYVKNILGEYNFTRIEIIVEGAEESLVTADTFIEKDFDGKETKISTVSLYDEILRNAE